MPWYWAGRSSAKPHKLGHPRSRTSDLSADARVMMNTEYASLILGIGSTGLAEMPSR